MTKKGNTMHNNKLGAVAMELIADYPLYASTSNITYDEAIAVAKIFFGEDLEKVLWEIKNRDALMKEYFKTDRKHSLEDYDKWVAEKEKGEK